jgi:hypothetical protein
MADNVLAGKRSSQEGKLAFIPADGKRIWVSPPGADELLTCLIGEVALAPAIAGVRPKALSDTKPNQAFAYPPGR